MQLILNGKVIWENPPAVGHFAIKLRKQSYEYELVDQLIMRAKDQFVNLIQRRYEMMEEDSVELQTEGWDTIGDSEQETEDLRRALAAATTELEDIHLALLEKELLLDELQQRVRELELERQMRSDIAAGRLLEKARKRNLCPQ